MTKIDIVSGFLGAGKTTLIKKLLGSALKGEKLVLIENEFGEIGIDGGFLKDSGIEITEMNSGCICCSLVGDFGTALKEVLEKYSPDRIVIEPSGVGKLSDVILAVKKVDSDQIQLNSFVTVADAKKCKMYMKNFGEFFNNQIENAGTIILSRTKNMDAKKLEDCVALLREHNAEATIITTDWDALEGEQILKAMEEKNSLEKELMEEETCPVCGGHHPHDHEEHEHHHHDGECCHHDHEEHEHHHHDGECCHHDHEEHEHHHHDGECCHHDHEEHEHHHHDGECCHHDHEGHHHHHADEVFSSWGKETPKKFTKEAVEEALKVLSESDAYGMILRAKGILPSEDGEWIYFDLVPGEYEIRSGAADITGKLCVIGSGLKEDELAKLFEV